MSIFLTVLHVFVCFVLVAVILFQAGKGQGLTGSSFGGGGGDGGVNTLFGTKTGDFFTKATAVCAILFLITCISLDIVEARRSRSIVNPSGQNVSEADIAKIKEALEKLKQEADLAKETGVAEEVGVEAKEDADAALKKLEENLTALSEEVKK